MGNLQQKIDNYTFIFARCLCLFNVVKLTESLGPERVPLRRRPDNYREKGHSTSVERVARREVETRLN
jgi:hypothetical protein